MLAEPRFRARPSEAREGSPSRVLAASGPVRPRSDRCTASCAADSCSFVMLGRPRSASSGSPLRCPPGVAVPPAVLAWGPPETDGSWPAAGRSRSTTSVADMLSTSRNEPARGRTVASSAPSSMCNVKGGSGSASSLSGEAGSSAGVELLADAAAKSGAEVLTGRSAERDDCSDSSLDLDSKGESNSAGVAEGCVSSELVWTGLGRTSGFGGVVGSSSGD
mmetsp:Transcript_18227/g.54853  ORF Transcript_18227/g.54853 Transcript_18227/m.54853 type:complete len:220 (-) Transcript_18227:565-1224(-)